MSRIKFRAMKTADLDYIKAIADQSFPTPWSAKTFLREIEINERGYYWVLVVEGGKGTDRFVISYGGYWLLDKEAHIVTIATHPEWRRQGWGKLQLILMINEAIKSGVEDITLEVRESNQIALQLYTSLGFAEEGRRKAYYSISKTSSEREDALILSCGDLQSHSSQCALFQAYESTTTRVSTINNFTELPLLQNKQLQ